MLIVLAISAFAVSKAFSPSFASSAVTIVGGNVYDSVPPQEICLDSPTVFSDKEYEFYSSVPTITDERNVWDYSYASTVDGKTEYVRHYCPREIVYRGPKPSTPSSIPGIFSMTWRDCGIDADGDRIDVKLVFSNIKFRYKLCANTPIYTCQPTDHFALVRIPDGEGGTGHWAPRSTNLAYDIEFFATKSSSGATAKGVFWSGVTGLTEPDSYVSDTWNSEYTEHIDLLSNYAPTVYKPPESTVRVFNDNTSFYLPYPRSPIIGGYYCGVVIGLQPNGGKIRWASTNTGGTGLFVPFGSNNIAASASPGGSIAATTGYTSPDGIASVGWKNSRSITATADPHYFISSVTVDGKQLDIPPNSTSYEHTFTNVREDHSIHVEFQRLKRVLSYDANAPDDVCTGTMDSAEADAGSDIVISDCRFAYENYWFAGWNTMPDGSGISYFPNSTFLIEEDTILYAQWERLVTVTFVDDNGEIIKSESVPAGGKSKPPEMSKKGYTFVAWHGTYSEVTQDETVVAEWTPNKYQIIYNANHSESEERTTQEMLYDTSSDIQDNEFSRPNYQFIGWNTSPDGNGTRYVPGDDVVNLTDEPDGEIVLYAQWEFYIRMPETGEGGIFLIWMVSITLVSIGLVGKIGREKQQSSVNMIDG